MQQTLMMISEPLSGRDVIFCNDFISLCSTHQPYFYIFSIHKLCYSGH